jgi:urea transport system permease protein
MKNYCWNFSSVITWIFSSLLLIAVNIKAQETTTSNSFESLSTSLAQSSLSERSAIINELVKLQDERVETLLTALQSGTLYLDTSETHSILAIKDQDTYKDIFTQAIISEELSSNLKRIPINNSLRNQLSTQIAQLSLNSNNSEKRLEAVNRMIEDGITEDSLAVLQERNKIEKEEKITTAIADAIALYNLTSVDVAIRAEAVKLLEGNLRPQVAIILEEIMKDDEDASVRLQAKLTFDSIQNRIAALRFAENIFFGLSLGSVLLLSAIGLSITFGVMGVINMAHGELMMIGAYVTWVVQQLFSNQIAYSLMIAIPAAFIVAGLVGIAIERGVIRFLYGRPLETLLATFGISLILQQAARSIFSPLNRAVELPQWMSGSLEINPVLSITFNRLFIFIFVLIVFLALLAILKKTSLGLKVRAVAQNRSMARAVGVRANWVDAMTFGLGSGIAGIAGVSLSQLTNVGPNLGQAYIIDSFMVVVFGGVGNLWGTLVGAMGLGIINKFLEPYAGAVLAKVLVLVLLILFIQKRPKGIFPQKGRAAAD